MPQVTRTTNDLIVNSLYLLGELGVGEIADNFMLSTGLELINELLDKFSADSIYIPYLTDVNFTMIPGVDSYSVSDMVPADVVADRIVDLTFGEYIVTGTGFSNSSIFQFNFPFTVNLANSHLVLTDTSLLPTGTPISVISTQAVPLPLISGVTYYVINLSTTDIQLASSAANAAAGINITLQTAGSGLSVLTAFNGPTVSSPTFLVYPLKIINKATYYGVVRQGGLMARPGFCFLNKQPTESFVTFYPAPDQPYSVRLQIKVMLNSLSAQEDLTALPPYYYGFMKYALARKFLAYYPSGNWPQQNEDEYQDYYNALKNANEVDLTITPSVVLTAPQPFYWPNILAY